MDKSARRVCFSAMIFKRMQNDSFEVEAVPGGARQGVLAERLDVRVLMAHYDFLSPHNWNHQPLGATHWRLYQHDAPGGFLDGDDGAVWHLEANRVYLIPSGRSFRSRCEKPCRQLYLHFDLLGFTGLSAHRELFPGPVAVPAATAFEASMANFGDVMVADTQHDLYCRNPARECWVHGLLCEALGRYFSSVPAENLERYHARLRALRPFLPALEHLNARLREVITNRDLAALCAMSEDHFIRRFRVAAGVTPAQYVLQRRITRSAELLLSTNRSIEDIAESTGFCDRSYFTHVFTRATGRPPATFRRGGG